MTTASAKAKARRLQNWLHELAHRLWPNLHPDDIAPRPMGQPGEDLILSPAARKVIFLATEAKNHEKTSPWEWVKQAVKNANGFVPVVSFCRNREKIPQSIIATETLFRMAAMIAERYQYSEIEYFLLNYKPFPYPLKASNES